MEIVRLQFLCNMQLAPLNQNDVTHFDYDLLVTQSNKNFD